MWSVESRRDAENRVYDSASEFAFVAQRLRMEMSRPEAVRVLAPVLACVHDAVSSLSAALRAAHQTSPDVDRSLEACAAAVEIAAQHCERARRTAARHPARSASFQR